MDATTVAGSGPFSLLSEVCDENGRTLSCQWHRALDATDHAQFLHALTDLLGGLAHPFDGHPDVAARHILAERMVDQSLQHHRAEVAAFGDGQEGAAQVMHRDRDSGRRRDKPEREFCLLDVPRPAVGWKHKWTFHADGPTRHQEIADEA